MKDPERAWNQFNAEYQPPDSDDALRIANEVKVSVDTWVQNSLNDLQDRMSRRADAQIEIFKGNIKEANSALKSVDKDLERLKDEIEKLSATDPKLEERLKSLKDAADKASEAMAAIAKDWEQKGEQAAGTMVEIAKTFAV